MFCVDSWFLGLTQSMVEIPNDVLLEKTDSPAHFLLVLTANNFLVKDRTLRQLLILSVSTLCGLNLCRSCEWCQSLCEFIHESFLFYVENAGPVDSPTICFLQVFFLPSLSC